MTIESGEIALIPSNVVVEVPVDHVLLVSLRSSTPRSKGLLIPHGVGVIDEDYCGPEDEVRLQVYNFTQRSVTVARGERIAQGMLVPISRASWIIGDPISRESRGGFGSTG